MTNQEFDEASRAAAGEKAQGEKAQGFARVSVRVELEARGGEMSVKFSGGPTVAGDKEDASQLCDAAALSLIAKKMHEMMVATFTRGWFADAASLARRELDRRVHEAAR